MKDFKLEEHNKIPSGFKAPDDYFDRLSEKINLRLTAGQPKVIPIYRKKNFMYAAAAVLVAALGITTYNAMMVQNTTADAVAIENYLAGQTSTEDNLVEMLGSEDIEKLNSDYELDDKAVEDILSHNANLEQYILN